jgi:hypothetical protein
MEGGQIANDVPACALSRELVWRLSDALLDDSSHALRDGTAAGNGSDDLRGEAIVVVCHEGLED